MATTTPPNDALRTALQQFVDSLTPSQLTEFLLLKTCPDSTAVLTFTAEIDRRNAKRRSRGVASRLFGVLESVRQFTSIIDTYIQAYPQVAALVWGSLKITLLAASNVASYFDKLSEYFMRLRTICPVFSEYQLLFADAPRLQTALCDFYATVVHFCRCALETMQRSGLEHAAKAFFRPFENEFHSFELELSRQSNHIKDEIYLAAATAADRERKLHVIHRSSSHVFWKKATQEVDEARSWRQKAKEQALKNRKMMALDTLSTYDYVATFNQARKKRHGTTGLWLSRTDEYQEWQQDPQSSVFWCSGILGAGKTVITAAMIDHILCSRSSEDSVSYFFCSSDDEKSLKARTIIGSLIRQTLDARSPSINIESKLEDICQRAIQDVEDLEPLFYEVLASTTKHFLIIDGIDECNKREKGALLDILEKAFSSSIGNIKLFLAGRDSLSKDVCLRFKLLHKKSVKGPEVQLDILNYVRDTLREKLDKRQLILGDTELLSEIQEALLRGADGMFLWVFFQIEDICEQETDEDIRKVLRNLPRNLNDTYERILTKIVKQRKSEIAGKVFRWVFTVKRPLSLGEIREALGVEPYQQHMKTDRLLNNVDQIIGWCKNLVMIDEEDQGIRFAHHSVREFLVRGVFNVTLYDFHFNIADFDHYVGEICVTYLNFSDFETQVIKFTEQRKLEVDPIDILNASIASDRSSNFFGSPIKLTRFWRSKIGQRYDLANLSLYAKADNIITPFHSLFSKYAFLMYACQYWLIHSARFTPDTPKAWKLWKHLIESHNALVEKPWVESDWANRSNKISKWIVENDHYPLLSIWISLNIPALEYAYLADAIAPDSQLFRVLYQQKQEKVNSTNVKPVIDLMLASAAVRGDLKMAREITGAAIFQNKPWESDCQALILAAAKGHLEIVDLLLESGVHKDSQDADGNTAALLAAANGHGEVLMCLKGRGAWLQHKNHRGITALDQAQQHCDSNTFSALTSRKYPGWGEYRGYQEDEADIPALFDKDGMAL